MNFFEFIASLVSSLIWPALVVVFVIVYRREIGGGLERLSNRVLHARNSDDVKHLFDGFGQGNGKRDRKSGDAADTAAAEAPGAGGFEAEFESMRRLLMEAGTGDATGAPQPCGPDADATGTGATGTDSPATDGDTEAGDSAPEAVTADDADAGDPAAVTDPSAATRPGLFERMSQVAATTQPRTAVLLAASALAGDLSGVAAGTGASGDVAPSTAIDALKSSGTITRETALTLHELIRLGGLAENDLPDRITSRSAADYIGIVDDTTRRLHDEAGVTSSAT